MNSQQKSTIQKLLDENSQLILLMLDLISKGKHNECLEHQRTLHRNLIYLIQFDPNASHHLNNLPSPETFIQTSSTMTNIQSSQIYRTQTTTTGSPANILNQSSQNNNFYSSPSINSLNKPNISQQRPSYSIQQNNYGQYSVGHSQQNHLVQQQWQNQSRMPLQQQQILPQT